MEGAGTGWAARNWEARLEKEVTRLYSSCVSVRIECKLICIVLRERVVSWRAKKTGRIGRKRKETHDESKNNDDVSDRFVHPDQLQSVLISTTMLRRRTLGKERTAQWNASQPNRSELEEVGIMSTVSMCCSSLHKRKGVYYTRGVPDGGETRGAEAVVNF